MEKMTPTPRLVPDRPSDALLPCPFCGEPVSVVSNRDWHRIQGEHAMTCPLADFEFATPATDHHLSLARADWNRRAAAPPAEAPAERSSVLPILGCQRPHAQVSTGPTTDQRNHFCPDCGTAWTTFPTHLAAAPAAPADAPFGHYFRDMEGRQHFHTGSTVPHFAQSDVTPLYTAPRVTGGREVGHG